jgi:pyrimidine-specific ribonucleoside hydrolase
MHVRRLTPFLLLPLALAACGVDGATGDEPPTTTVSPGAVADPAEPPTAVAPSAGERVPVIVDYSPTTSDVTALLYVAQHRSADLIAVTLAGTGESHCEQGVANTRALLASLDLGAVPVACGQDQPVADGNQWPDDWREAADRLDGLDLVAPEPTADDGGTDAADLIASIARERGPVTIVGVGPLTNLAVAIERHPDLPDHVSGVVTMGGAIAVAGNATNGVAEWNYFIDPTAADVVLRSGMPVTMVPLDATDQVPVTRAWFDALTAHRTTTAANAVHGLFAANRPFDFGFYFWDELAAAVAFDPDLVTIDEQPITIELHGPEQGRSRIDEAGTPVRIAVAADRERFEQELLTTLNGGVVAPEVPPASNEEIEYFRVLEGSVAELSAAIEPLFQTPVEEEIDEIAKRAEQSELTPEDEVALRMFFTEFWTVAVEQMTVHRDALRGLDPPASVRVEHDAYIAALGAMIDTRDDRLVEVATRDAAELLGILWEPDDEVETFDAACEALGAVASSLGITAVTCLP